MHFGEVPVGDGANRGKLGDWSDSLGIILAYRQLGDSNYQWHKKILQQGEVPVVEQKFNPWTDDFRVRFPQLPVHQFFFEIMESKFSYDTKSVSAI